MTKMDALNQQTLMKCFHALREVNIGLYTSESLVSMIQEIQDEYMESVINILGGEIDE